MPSIRKIRDEKKKLSEQFMHTVCRYNYGVSEEERKKKMFLLKKNKYEKIKAIRQNHHR